MVLGNISAQDALALTTCFYSKLQATITETTTDAISSGNGNGSGCGSDGSKRGRGTLKVLPGPAPSENTKIVPPNPFTRLLDTTSDRDRDRHRKK